MKKSKHTLTPKLRFPAFRDSPGWKERPLSEILSEHGLKSTGSEQVFSVSVHKGLVNQIEHLGRSFSASSTDHYNRVLPGDIVYTKSPTGDFPLGIVKQSKLDFPVIVSPLYGVFSPETTGLGVILDAYFESSANAKIFLEPLVQKGAKNTINIKNSRFLSGTLILPLNKDEQRTIGDFLTSIDELIAAEGRKLEALKAHKKGLMQQLFPREGETTPKIRLPGFREKWEIDALEDLCTARISYGIVQAGPHVPDGMPYIKSTDLNSRIRLSRLERTSETIARKYRRSEVVPGDLVFSLRGNIGVSQIVPPEIPVANLTQGTARIRTKGPSQFYLQALQSPRIHNRILEVSKGSTFQEISLEDLRKIQVLHPDETEQQQIADCLSALDTQITAQAAKIGALGTHKHGLMQQLFPPTEEQ